MNNSQEVKSREVVVMIEKYISVSQEWPSRMIGTWKDQSGSCCAIHRKIVCGLQGQRGCAGKRYGTHGAVRAVYESDAHRCLIEDGQRYLDHELRDKVVYGDRKFLNIALARGSKFCRRYMSGFKADVGTYGAGFCYLHLFVDTARSRVARILGPLPLLADVLRMCWHVGAKVVESFVVEELYSGVHHVAPCHDGLSKSWIDVLHHLTDIVEKVPLAVVGVELSAEDLFGGRAGVMSRFGNLDVQHDLVFHGGMKEDVVPRGFFSLYRDLVYDWPAELDILSLDGRFGKLYEWFYQNKIELPEEASATMMLATMAPAFHTGVSNVAKDQAKLYAIVGDGVIKTAVALECLAMGGSGSEFTSMHSVATNERLARALDISGLRDVCLVDGLSVTSKANASIVEAVVGVLSVYSTKVALKTFLCKVGVLHNVGSLVQVNECVLKPLDLFSNVVQGLNSIQHKRAVELARRGLLG